MIRLTQSFASAIVDSIGAARRQVMEGSHSMGELPARLVLLRLHWVSSVNLLHYPLCPADCVGDGCHGRRHSRSAVVLRQLPCRKDRGGDQQNALATFVHLGSLALSLCIRHTVARRADAHARGGEVCDAGAKAKALCTW